MALNPLIALSTQVPDITGATNQLVQGIEQGRERKERNRLLESSGTNDINRINSVGIFSEEIMPDLQAGNLDVVEKKLTRRRESLAKAGISTEDTDIGLQLIKSDPQKLMQRAQMAIDLNNKIRAQTLGTPSGLREFQGMTQGLSKEDREKARRIELGLDPRAVGTGAITTATTEGLTGKVAESEGTIAGAKSGASERAELDAQLEKLPGVKAAVAEAEARVKQEVDADALAKKNGITLNMYETAMKGLTEGLAGADTGPVAGRLPAVTTDAQIAEGAVSAMAPILKSMFRTAGEGTFTDKDQELLLNMVPTRKDTPEARKAKMQNIDAIVRAKLGQSSQPGQSVGRFQVEVLP